MKSMRLVIAFLAALCLASCATAQERKTPKVSTIGGMPGPEDLVVDESLGTPRLLVSSVDHGDRSLDGAIFSVDPKTRAVTRMEITGNGKPVRFRPHGIALLPEKDRKPRLFVINHGSDLGLKESIEVFRVEATELLFEERITGRGLVKPNDLAVLAIEGGGYELFVTNPVQGGFWSLWEALLGPKKSFVARFRSGVPDSTRIDGFRYANGVAVHGGKLYVASSMDGKVFRYDLKPQLSRERAAIELDAVVDNITVEPEGTLLVTASTSGWAFMKHAKAAEAGDRDVPQSPTEVWRVHPADPVRTTLLFEDSGWRISGGSSAVCVGGDLYIGQVFGDYLLHVSGACAAKRR